MRLSPHLVLPRVRCAAVHGSAGVDPAGSAPTWDAVVVAEVPLPWPKDISTIPPFSALLDSPEATVVGADGRRWRPQAIVPRGAGEGTRLMAFERGPRSDEGLAGPFQRREWVLPDTATVVDLLRALLRGGADAVASFQRWRADPPAGTVDLLVCTHGTRDVCCGGSGAATYSELVGLLGADELPGMRVWRASHAAGHRFAPTALSLPDGTSWAHLTAGVAAAVVRRADPAAEVAPHCRGAVTLEGAPVQLADREAMARFGWEWLDRERTATIVAHERDTLATTVEVRAVGSADAVRVRVELDRHIAMPTCGEVAGPEFATEAVWRAASVEPA